MRTQNIQKMTIKTITQLLYEGFTIEHLLDLLMDTEAQSFVPLLQENRETYKKRIAAYPDYIYFFYDENNNYFGYFCGEFLNKVPENSKEIAFNHIPVTGKGRGIFYISSFAINKNYRQKHLGKTMFEMVFNILIRDSSIKEMVLLVNEKWGSARRIYETFGFKVINEFPKVFPPETADKYTSGLLMKLFRN